METAGNSIVTASDALRILRRLKIDDQEKCWLWTGAKIWNGYGAVSCKPRGSWMLVHRAVFAYCRGPIPDGLCVLHRCDVRNCANPSHLFLGTYKDNAIDRNKKGRHVDNRGENHGQVKLTCAQILEIRADKRSSRKLAKIYNVSKSQILRIKRLQSWIHIGSTKCV